MKVKDKVIINEGIYKGVKAVITGFEHFIDLGDTDKVIINDNPKIMDFGRVELQVKTVLACHDLIKDNKVYFAVKDFDLT